MQDIGSKYKTQIPSLTENADIQTALRVYHYGAASEPGTLVSNSIAGHLETLENTKVDIVPIQIVAGASNNLNSKTTTGYYSISTDAIAAAGTNYPSSATAGMLHVINDGSGIIYQTYIMSGVPPKMLWRGFYSGGWSSWTQAATTDHSHAEFNTLANAISTKQPTINGAATSIVDADLSTEKVVVTDSSGKIAASASITTTELGNLNGTTGTVPSLAGTIGANGTSKRIFIQELTPNTTNNPGFVGQVGDLWFW